MLDLLGNLVDRSLVILDDEGPADRYRLLESIKQYARARLDESGDGDAVLDRHLTHFADLARRLAPDLETGAQRAARPVLEREAENLRVALEHAATRPDPELLATLAFDLTLFWHQTAGFTQGDHWLGLAAARLADAGSAIAGRVLWARGYLNFYFGNFDEAYDLATAGLEAAERAGDPLGTARCLDLQADVTQLSTPMPAARILEVARERAEAAGDTLGGSGHRAEDRLLLPVRQPVRRGATVARPGGRRRLQRGQPVLRRMALQRARPAWPAGPVPPTGPTTPPARSRRRTSAANP